MWTVRLGTCSRRQVGGDVSDGLRGSGVGWTGGSDQSRKVYLYLLPSPPPRLYSLSSFVKTRRLSIEGRGCGDLLGGVSKTVGGVRWLTRGERTQERERFKKYRVG